MPTNEPTTHIDVRYGDTETATPWSTAAEALDHAELFWLSTRRERGTIHVTPLIAVWLDDSMFFCTGDHEQKFRNIAADAACTFTTGRNDLHGGLDIVVEGEAVRVSDDAVLQRVADRYESKYGSEWHFDVRDGAFAGGDDNQAIVFEVAPTVVYGFGKAPYSQTRWTFDVRH